MQPVDAWWRAVPAGMTRCARYCTLMFRRDVLNFLHCRLRPELYVEIGIRAGASLRYALPGTSVIGVDPSPRLSYRYPFRSRIFVETSDAFFDRKDIATIIHRPIDFGFIDGMHHFEYALRDFINIERYSAGAGVVVIDDPYPKTKEQAGREIASHGAWAGDVWRTIAALREMRRDLNVQTFDVGPTGMTIVSSLDPTSTVLNRDFDEISRRFAELPYSEDVVRDAVCPVAPRIDLLEKILPPPSRAFPPLGVAMAGRALRPPHPRSAVAWLRRNRAKLRPE